MRPDESFVGQSIRSLQTMLRHIADVDGVSPSVVPDGIYGADTVQAVTFFQRRNGIPATGVTDQQTWDAIVTKFEPARIELEEAEPLLVVLNPGQIIRQGERHPNLYIVQAILMVLSQLYGGINAPGMTGVLDLATADSLSSFQELHRLPVTGELDKGTWKTLALQYPLAVNVLMP